LVRNIEHFSPLMRIPMVFLVPVTQVAAPISFARATFKAKKTALLLFSVGVLLAGGAEAVLGQSALDGFDPNANGAVRAVVVQPDGKILIGGDFTTLSPNGSGPVTRNRIARLNPDGTLDTAFDPNASDEVDAIVVQADGKILVGGVFNGANSIGGQTRNRIARLDATTGLADSFDPNANSFVQSIAVQADGKILIGGFLTSLSPNGGAAVTRNGIARLNTDGTLDASFDPNATGGSDVRSIAVQTDGKILIGGFFNTLAPNGGPAVTRHRIARLNTDGTLDASFDPNANSGVQSIAVQVDGKILIGGNFGTLSPNGGAAVTRNGIARLNTDGTLDASFDPNANNLVESVTVQTDGRILIGGPFGSLSPNGGAAVTRHHIARLNTDGTLDASFDPNVDAVVDVFSIAVQPDGKILMGGSFTSLSPNGGATVTRNRIARLERDGRLDQTLDLSAVGSEVFAIAIQPDGKTLIGGFFSSVLGVTRNGIARLNTDGTLDTAFNPNANGGVVEAIAVQVDGRVLVSGEFNLIGGQIRNNIARLDATTGLADSFDPNANAAVFAIAVQADGKVLAAGSFTTIGGQSRRHIARLDATTGAADSFDPNANTEVDSIAVQADGKILAGGAFTTIGGQTRNFIARLDATTGLADSFNPNANSQVYSIAVQADGKVLVGGNFSGANSIGGQTRNRLARLDATTGAADSFDPNANFTVYSIAVQADGKVLVGGDFFSIGGANSIGGQTRNFIARLDATTGLADSFDPNANDHVFSIAVQADGKILAGGTFTSIGGQTRSRFARLSNDTAALQNLAVTQTTVTWTRGGSSPQFTRVTFENSNDNVTYSPLGNGTPAGSNWTRTGLSLSTGVNFYIRARGYYPSGHQNGSESITESVRYVFIIPPTVLANISTRLPAGTGDNVLIGGFIVTGSQNKKIIVRAIGPSLTLAGKLADPTLELRDGSGALLEANDNWMDSPNKQAIIDSTIPPSDPLESAIVRSVPPGNYTAIERGVNNGTGIGVVEAYDLDTAANSKLANISTRGLVQTGDNVLFAGMIVVGQASQKVIIRALGPSTGVPGAMADPTLELHDGNGALLEANDNWVDSPNKQAIIDSTIPPPNNLESAIVRTLTPANYTAIVRGANNTTGIAVVEIYALN
jgi:uncharacterized delta-60 repeat protein